jgi:aryl sulfotransferase
MQTIVGQLIFWDDMPEVLLRASPWLDMRIPPLDPMREQLAAQTHRRFIKSHLPLDGLPYRPDSLYIMVGRDPRDVFMSLWNHYRCYTPLALSAVNDLPGRVGDPMPPCPEDILELWRGWTTRGWFEWEQDGWPWFSMLHHARTWWEYRDLPNIRLFHYNDMLADLPGEVRRIAEYLGIERTDRELADIAEASRFESIKKDPERITGQIDAFFQGGAHSFIHKGTNGRWKDVLGPEHLDLYEEAVRRTLPPDCARWLECGGALD